MELQNKLAKFESAVYAEVEAKVVEIRSQAEAENEQRIAQNQEEMQRKSAERLQKKLQDIRQKSRREIARYSLESKRSILKKRSEISDRIFDSVTLYLSEYRATSEYKDYLLNKIREFSNKNPLSGVEILIGEQDVILSEEIKKAYGLPCNVIIEHSVSLGGFLVRDDAKCIYFDESLTQKLAEQKAYFIENSSLALS